MTKISDATLGTISERGFGPEAGGEILTELPCGHLTPDEFRAYCAKNKQSIIRPASFDIETAVPDIEVADES